MKTTPREKHHVIRFLYVLMFLLCFVKVPNIFTLLSSVISNSNGSYYMNPLIRSLTNVHTY